ncbi:hypothetical protein D1007_06151 [Hordeum vulgare]|nr:hypothetical protein D1007_06151 [Hordeum vulgare]
MGMGECELAAVSALLVTTPIWAGDDEWRMLHVSASRGRTSASSEYKLARFGGVAPYVAYIWGPRTSSSRVKFFCWLMVQCRIHTHDVLLRKYIVAANIAGCPICWATLESADHLVFSCPFAASFSRAVGVPVAGASMDCLESLVRSVGYVVWSVAESSMLCCSQV